MNFLNNNEIAKISNKLKDAEISYSHLYDDLLDHLCCEIELYLEKGYDFDKSFSIVFDKIGLSELKEIQEATIFYVKLNLTMMKKLMNVLAIIGTTVLVTGFLFKINHWPGGSILFALGFLAIFLFFFPSALFRQRSEMGVKFFSKQFLAYFIGFIVLMISGIAILFTSMHWPGGNYLVFLSWILTFLVFFPILFYKIIKSDKNKPLNLALSIFILLYLGVNVVFSYNSRTDLFNVIDFKYVDIELKYYQEQVDAENNSLSKENFSNNLEKLKEYNILLNKIDATINHYNKIILNGKDNIYEVVKDPRHNSDMSPEYDNGLQTLRTELQEFSTLSKELSKGNNFIEELIDNQISVQKQDYGILGSASWHKRLFQRGSYSVIYTNLCKTQKTVYQVYYEVVLYQKDIKDAPEL